MGFEVFCMTLIALLIGMAIAFNGYRLFLILLPIWGFIFGFGLGAQTMTVLFGTGFLATATSWVVGFIVALVFAALSYLFYFIGVALFAGSIGYYIGVGLMGLFGFDLTILTWIVGIVLAIVVAGATIMLNIQKWVIILATSMGGAAVIIGSFLFVLGIVTPADIGMNAVKAAITDSWWWFLGWLVLAAMGFAAQVATTKTFVLEEPEPVLEV
jgi:hypothetical protein